MATLPRGLSVCNGDQNVFVGPALPYKAGILCSESL